MTRGTGVETFSSLVNIIREYRSPVTRHSIYRKGSQCSTYQRKLWSLSQHILYKYAASQQGLISLNMLFLCYKQAPGHCLNQWWPRRIYAALGRWAWVWWVEELTPRQYGRHFADDIFKCIFLNKSVWILINTSQKLVPKGPNNNTSVLVQIMAWCRPGVTRPQCVRDVS